MPPKDPTEGPPTLAMSIAGRKFFWGPPPIWTIARSGSELRNVHGNDSGCSSESSVEACRGEFRSLFDALETARLHHVESCCIMLHP